MDRSLEKFTSIVENPYPWLRRWKEETGKKVIGCFPMYVPEEIIHAAGMLPVTLLGSDEAIKLADQYVHPYICQLVRGNFDLSLRGELDCLDGVVFSDFCLTVQMISDIWRLHKPAGFYRQMIMPKNVGASYARGYLMRQSLGLKEALEEFGGREISEESLKQSISIYNHNRGQLHRLYQLRRSDPGLFKARDIANVVAASMLMPKEEHSQLLSELLERVQGASRSADGKPRVVLSGYLCDMPELDVLDLIEKLGAVVSDDDLYVGRRYFHTLTREDISPLEALAERYIEDVPCPTKLDLKKDWAGYLLGLAKEAKAEGIITVVLKYCEVHLLDLPYLKASLSQGGMRYLVLETSHSGVGATGQVKTRIEAFLETLGGSDES